MEDSRGDHIIEEAERIVQKFSERQKRARWLKEQRRRLLEAAERNAEEWFDKARFASWGAMGGVVLCVLMLWTLEKAHQFFLLWTFVLSVLVISLVWIGANTLFVWVRITESRRDQEELRKRLDRL